MARKSSNGSMSGEHLSLALAAHLARTQLIPDPLQVHDGRHPGDMLNVVAQALARTAPLHVTDTQSGETRSLTATEVEGAVAQRGATLLILKDGRALEGVSVRRAELRQAIAVLKAVGLQDVAPPAAADKPAVRDSAEGLRAHLAEVEAMLKPPLLPAQVERAKAAAVWIARHAREGRVANLAMQLMSALHETRGIDEIPGGFRLALARLRAAIEEGASSTK